MKPHEINNRTSYANGRHSGSTTRYAFATCETGATAASVGIHFGAR